MEDHLGNKFKTVSKMCEFHGINRATFYARIKRGCTIEEALNPITEGTPYKGFKGGREFEKKPCVDHLGNNFGSISDMCEHYGITYQVFRHRQYLGWELKNILTRPIGKTRIGKQIVDHKGKTYKSLTDLAKSYNISYSKLDQRLRAGWTIEEALKLGIPAPIITMSLQMRLRSQQSDTFAGKVVSSLRNGFGGHAVEQAR